MVSGEMDDGLYYLEFMNWLSSKFRKHKKMNVVTKNALWDFWLKCGDEEELEDDIESSESELEESDYESHHNSTTRLRFFFNLIWMLKRKGTFVQLKKGMHITKRTTIATSDLAVTKMKNASIWQEIRELDNNIKMDKALEFSDVINGCFYERIIYKKLSTYDLELL
ncbi:hypothetical protein Tco_0218214 [Tanacetum coccineum]